MESSQRKDFGILMRLRCWIGEDFKSEIASERHRPHSLGSRRCQEGAPWNFWSRSHPGKSGRGWSTRAQGVEMGRQHETVVGLLPAIWRSLGTREVHWGFQGVDEDLIWNLPITRSISHQHNPIKTSKWRCWKSFGVARRMLCMSHVLKSFVRLFFLGKTEGDCGEVVSRV